MTERERERERCVCIRLIKNKMLLYKNIFFYLSRVYYGILQKI